MNRRSFLKMIPGLGAAAVLPSVIGSEQKERTPDVPATFPDPDKTGNFNPLTGQYEFPVKRSGTPTIGTTNLPKELNPVTRQFQEFPVSLGDYMRDAGKKVSSQQAKDFYPINLDSNWIKWTNGQH